MRKLAAAGSRTMPFALATGALLALAGPAAAAPQTVVVNNDRFSPADVSLNAGETITWDVQEGGHNIDVYSGPETWKSTSGKDSRGTQVTRAWSQAGTYKYICDYHGSMKGTFTVVAATQPPAGGGGTGGSGSG